MRLSLAALVFLCFADTASADSAEELWKQKCKSCHGEDGRARTKVGQKEGIPDMTSPDWQSHHSDAFIKRVIQEGSEDNPKMKPFRNKLTEAEIVSLVQYIRAFNPTAPKPSTPLPLGED